MALSNPKYTLAALVLSILIPACANAGPVTLSLNADDFGVLLIDGTLVGSYDGQQAGQFSATLDLAAGWHRIEIDYRNRWDSNGLELSWQYPGDGIAWVVPVDDLRSSDAAGGYVPGLRADYFDLSGNVLFTVYGEGPIQHGAQWFGDAWAEMYQGQPNLWAGQFGTSAVFAEQLTGEINIGSGSARDMDDAPEPGTLGCMALGGAALLVVWRRGRAGRRCQATGTVPRLSSDSTSSSAWI